MIPGALTNGQSNLVHGTQDLKMAVDPIVMVAMPNCNEPTLKWPRRIPLGEVAEGRALIGGIEAFFTGDWEAVDGPRCRQSQRLTERLLPPRSGSICPWTKSSMTFFHVRHPQKSRGFSGVSAAASGGGHFIHGLLCFHPWLVGSSTGAPGSLNLVRFLEWGDSCSANGFPIGIGDGWVARQRASDVRSPRAIGTGPLSSLRPGEKTSSRDRCSPSRRACRSANC